MGENINILLNKLQSFSNVDISSLPQRIQNALKEIYPDKILIYNNKPIILFFRVSNKITINDVFRKYWNFSEAPIVFIEKENNIEIYNGFDYVLKDGKPNPKKIEDIKNLNYYSLISGEYFLKNKEFKNENRVDKVLLKNIKEARNKILSKLNSTKKEEIANALIGRIIFIRYLIDRKIELFYKGKKQKITKDIFIDILKNKKDTYSFFKDLQSDDKGFNGDWFPISEEEKTIINENHLKILVELLKGTDLKSGQGSLFDYYDFSIIPIEFISNVYEHFINEKKQKKEGAYYTPTFLVDYVLKYTIDKYFEENPNSYNCKVLDPACGSGIFLVEAFRKLVAQYEKVNKRKADENALKQLVLDNIFGIDINKSALQISVFSLYLAMLDYQEPKDIKNFKFPYLTKGKKPNFFNNDFFDLKAPFNDILKKEKINFIIGNPPYGRGVVNNSYFAKEYTKNKIYISNNEIVQAFITRIKDFKNIKVGFIVTSKIFYNIKAKKFRKFFLENFKIEHILELSSVRKEIFGSATTPVSIIFYEYKNKPQKNIIKYISMKPNPYFEKAKFLLLTKQDFKKVSQSKLITYDNLWKILVYGSYLDFSFIKRLEKNKIVKHIDASSTGINLGNKKNYIPMNYLGLEYIKPDDIVNYYIRKSKKTLQNQLIFRAEGVRKITVFKSPALLMTKGINTALDSKMAITYKDVIFQDTITSIKCTNLETLYNIMGIFKSSVFKYYILQTASSIGIEREQLHNPEKFSAPYVKSLETVKIVKELENLQKEYFDTKSSNILNYEKQFKKLTQELDNAVMKALNLTEQEKALIDYTTNIVIPWVIQKKYDVAFNQYKYKAKEIEDYAEIFIKQYSKMYEKNGMFFQVNIYWSKYAIAMYFKILVEKQDTQIIWKKEENIEKFLTFMKGKTLENLFIQKDIKGFEQDGFYVVKPNEIKNWHKAVGYLDFYEFEDAILKSGR